MEIKKYLSGAIFLVLISSACAREEALSKKKSESFYKKNKTAVVATATGLVTAAIGAAAIGLVYRDGENNTIVGMRDLRDLSEKAIKADDSIVRVENGIAEIEVKLKAADLGRVARTKLTEQLRIVKDALVFFKAKVFLDESIEKADVLFCELDNELKKLNDEGDLGVHIEKVH